MSGRLVRWVLMVALVVSATGVMVGAGPVAPAAAADADPCPLHANSVLQRGDEIIIGGSVQHCGSYMLRSLDGGQTWSRPGAPSVPPSTSAYVGTTGFEAGRDGVIARGSNRIYLGAPTEIASYSDDGEHWDLRMPQPDNTSWGWAPSIYDRGHHWTLYNSSTPDNPVYGVMTEDGLRPLPTTILPIDLERTSPAGGIVVGVHRETNLAFALRTNDNGLTWAPTTLPGVSGVDLAAPYDFQVEPSGGGAGAWRVPGNNNGPGVGATHTSDGGATWSNRTTVWPAGQATTTSSPSATTSYIAGWDNTDYPNYNPRLSRTTDAGATWHPVPLPTSNGMVTGVSFTTPLRGTIVVQPYSSDGVGGPPAVYRTSNGGQTWTAPFRPSEHSFPGSPVFDEGTPATATRSGSTATLTFPAPAADGGSPITGFEATARRLDAPATTITATASPTARSISLSGLAPTGRYEIILRVRNQVGNSDYVRIRPTAAPGIWYDTPTMNGRAVNLVMITPAAVGAPTNTLDITPYRNGVAQAPISFPVTAPGNSIQGENMLLPAGTYRFTVTATNIAGTSAPSALSPEIVVPASVPGAPASVAAVAGNGQATVTWTPPSDDGGSAVTGYVVTPYANGVAGTPRSLGSTIRTSTFTGLANGTTYSFSVAATSSIGTGQTAESDPVTPTAALPGAPTGVTAVAGDAEATVTWSAPASNGGSPINGYVITPYQGAKTLPPTEVPATPRSAVVSGLDNGVATTFRVAARTSAGVGAQSVASAPVTPIGPTLPGAPQSVQATPGDERATVTWSPPTTTGGVPLDGYWVRARVAGEIVDDIYVYADEPRSATLVNLTNGVPVAISVAAENEVGLGAEATVTVTPTASGAPPGAPRTVGAQGRNRAVVATWTPPASAGSSAVTGYTVTVLEGSTVRGTASVGAAARTATVSGLSNGTSYTVRVAARSSAGTGPTAAAPGTTVPVPYASTAALVSQTFRDLTGKSPTASQSSTWIAQIDAHTKAPADLVAALRRSSDATGVVDPVARLYRAYFGRIPDAGGLTYWIGKRRGGTSLSTISEGFARSNEFRRTYGALTNRQFVERIYQNVLGRPGEASGVTYWTGQLDRKRKTRGAVMVGFSESNEYKRTQTAEVDTAVVFISLLGRAPTQPEHTEWVAALERTTNPATVTTLAAAVMRDPGWS